MNPSTQAPTLRQVLSGLGALGLLAYGAYGIWIDDLMVPGKRSSLHLGGLSAWLMAAALVSVAIHLLSAVAGDPDAQPTATRSRIVRMRAWRSAGLLAGLSLWLQLAGVRFPYPNQLNAIGITLGFLLFLASAAFGWAQGRRERERSALQGQPPTPTRAMTNRGTRILALLLLASGGLLIVPLGLVLIVNGRMVSPAMATLGIALTSAGAWVWLQARSLPEPATDDRRPGREGTWWPLQVGAVLILCVWASVWLDLSPRETGELGPTASMSSEKGAAVSTPELTVVPAQFHGQTKDGLVAMLRAEGQGVRCYGDLKGRERIAPSITQVCVLNTKRTWGMPVEDVSFHFAGEVLQMARYEFAHDEWPNVRNWFFASEGQDVGTFGQDGAGNKISGRHVADGLLMTAPPPRRGSVMVLWEARSLMVERCGKKLMEPWQEAVLCPGVVSGVTLLITGRDGS